MSERESVTSVAVVYHHAIDACFNNGWDDAPAWKIVCECQWEAWDYPSEASVRCSHAFHVAKELADLRHTR